MKRHLQYLFVCAVLCAIATPIYCKILVDEFTGNRSTDTVEFEVEAPWILDWRVTADFPLLLAVEVTLFEANTGAYLGSVLKTKMTGNGVRLFDQSGIFRFRVNSTLAKWYLRVEQISKDELKLYTPQGSEQDEEDDTGRSSY